MRRILWFTALMICPVLMGLNHPFYVAVIEAECSSKTKEIGIACKVFPDDLEEALRLFSKKKFDLASTEKTRVNEILNTYFARHLKVEVNGRQKAIEFLGYENDNGATWIYFSVSRTGAVKRMVVETDLLYEYRPEQTNIIHLNLDGKRTSHRLNAPQTRAAIQL